MDQVTSRTLLNGGFSRTSLLLSFFEAYVSAGMDGVPSPVAGGCVVFFPPGIAPLRLVPHVEVGGFPDLALAF
jgi:hypothetical protein